MRFISATRGKEPYLHQEWRRKGCPDEGPTTAELCRRVLAAPKKADDRSADKICKVGVAAPKPAIDTWRTMFVEWP